jgi:hypothetical protein
MTGVELLGGVVEESGAPSNGARVVQRGVVAEWVGGVRERAWGGQSVKLCPYGHPACVA